MSRREMEVWQEIAKNAEQGAERLVAEYGDRLYAAATLLCRNNGDAEELVFRTLAQAVVKIRQYKPSGDFFSWLYTILLNWETVILKYFSGMSVEEVATTLGIPPFIIGMVIVGFGTSAPELVVSALSGMAGHSNLSLGNAYGSNFFNSLAVVGTSGAISPFRDVSPLVFTRDLPVMVLLTLSIGIFGFNVRKPRSSGTISRLCEVIWLAAFLAYLFLLFRQEAFTNFVRRGE